jgi:hypothetical protein
MMKLLRRLDRFLDRRWRSTHAAIVYLFDRRKDPVDIDWLNMHNDMKLDEKKNWESKTKTYLNETKHIDKWIKNDNK